MNTLSSLTCSRMRNEVENNNWLHRYYLSRGLRMIRNAGFWFRLWKSEYSDYEYCRVHTFLCVLSPKTRRRPLSYLIILLFLINGSHPLFLINGTILLISFLITLPELAFHRLFFSFKGGLESEVNVTLS